MRPLCPFLLLAPALLVGCKMESSIAIEPNGSKPAFVVTYDNGKKACVMGFTVASAETGQREVMWSIRQGDKATCTDRFTYGETPAGYAVVNPARPLSSGRSYRVDVSGVGWQASKPLVVR